MTTQVSEKTLITVLGLIGMIAAGGGVAWLQSIDGHLASINTKMERMLEFKGNIEARIVAIERHVERDEDGRFN